MDKTYTVKIHFWKGNGNPVVMEGVLGVQRDNGLIKVIHHVGDNTFFYDDDIISFRTTEEKTEEETEND